MFRPLRRLTGKSRFVPLLGVTLILGMIISQITPAIQPVRGRVPAMDHHNSEVIWMSRRRRESPAAASNLS